MKLMRFIILAACLFAAPGADWPQLMGPGRNGVSAEKGLLETWSGRGPTVAWQRDVGDGYASPIVVGDALILYHRVGDADTTECLEAATGKPVWKSAYRTDYSDPLGKGNGPRSTPVAAGGKVYTLGAGGQLQCLDLKTGNVQWKKALLESYTVRPSYFGVGTTPIVEGKLLLVNVGGEGAGIVAFDKDSGKEVWKASNDEASYSSPIAATVDGVRHVFFFTRTGLVSVDPATGKVRFSKRWRARINASVNAAMPVLLGGEYLFLSASYQTGAVLLKVKKDRVEEVWKGDEIMSCHFGTPVAVGEHLYGFDGRQEEGTRLRCIEWKTGKVCWTEEGYGCGALIAADGKLWIMSEGSKLVLAQPGGKAFVEKAGAAVLGRPFRSHLALANGLLYARDEQKLVCWKVKK